MDRIVVIANPAASQFTGGSHRDVMATLGRAGDVEAIWPGSAREAGERAAEAADAGADLVVAMGGDGIVHHVSQGLVGGGTALGVIPVGTTNVFARLLGISSKPIRAARALVAGRDVARIGVARMELTRGSTSTAHHSVFACGLGLDAEVVRESDKEPYRKYRFGSIHYARTALGLALRSFPRRDGGMSVTDHTRAREASAVLIQFRSVYTFFGRKAIRIRPETPDPMTALLIGRLRRRRIPGLLSAVLSGRDLGGLPDLETWPRVERLSIAADRPVPAQADGEFLGMVEAAEITWVPRALGVRAAQLSPR